MKNIGIVCEYNPFHRGHAKQIAFVNGQGASICLMSGNYVQRGEPAILDKYVRAKAAVMGGANLVLELPLTYAIASAAGPLFNTVLFMSAMYIFFGKEQVVLDAFALTGAVPFFVFVFGLVFANAMVELLVTLLIGTAVCVALDHAKVLRK
jgi:predicted nucleotidyltransferase